MNNEGISPLIGREQKSAPCDLRRYSKSVRALATLGLLSAGPAFGHGGVAMEKDVCKLRLGPYLMHFTGYQIRNYAGNTEFCEDIPQVGKTVIVMDAIDPILREIPINVRIVRDTGNNNEVETELEKSTIVNLPTKVYPTGSVSLEYDFQQPGQFVGIVTAGENGEYVSRFPFSVGINRSAHMFYALLAAIPILVFGLYAYALRKRRAATGG